MPVAVDFTAVVDVFATPTARIQNEITSGWQRRRLFLSGYERRHMISKYCGLLSTQKPCNITSMSIFQAFRGVIGFVQSFT
jgi:hypothetical protein